ncbi:hypothetical protein HA49_20970 [Tatumella morbirosei]|uniref:HTH araC/xylS-type domain-containing protein n=1 Tax=Tatumella morbirosei TaxID=642227 RepID=A0A095V6F5_9GAMM|nr:helix-turn-helix domain-containing protein [Tatumella morbirosei]KGD70395.2 hypothetical protein HA49_20970 [Tatumella morbirosei]
MHRPTNIYSSVIEDLIVWIEHNLSDDLSIKSVASRAGYSRWFLQRIFKEYMDISLATYIRHRRLEMAKVDIVENRYKILDIAIKYGYSSQQEFTRVFKRITGYPPAEYRRITLEKKL